MIPAVFIFHSLSFGSEEQPRHEHFEFRMVWSDFFKSVFHHSTRQKVFCHDFLNRLVFLYLFRCTPPVNDVQIAYANQTPAS